MGFLQKIREFFQKRKKEAAQTLPEEKVFSDYIARLPKILTYLRRMQGIARRDLELTVIDAEEQPAWKVAEALERLVPEVRLLYVLTRRPEEFEELQEEIMEATGLWVELRLPDAQTGAPGNLKLDMRDWENQLDIVKTISYNPETI